MKDKYIPVLKQQSFNLAPPKYNQHQLIDVHFGLWIHQQFEGLYDLSEDVIANIEQERLQRTPQLQANH